MVLWGSKNYRLYSGLFVLLELKAKVGLEDVRKITEHALSSFPQLTLSPVLTHVWSSAVGVDSDRKRLYC